ncbi:hypothetical protein [Psychromonas sp. Urea-02u-13]|uniref:hypothetical protein n=1 Tax=Psychromonas sp. Urea-02u-13 TaxID=2058326 RepID=UPI000C34217D|nr:hypothetical protein [Psychromonas sp. Urea-02u-13]PKG37005.1 hypothetical protein CXF74_21175 [Psychromonas sp. Urea-02u-13]
MNESDLKEYLTNLVQLNNIKNEMEFTAFLQSNTNVKDEIVCNCENVFWLSFEHQTYDGWYCLKDARLTWYSVYFKEHGTTRSFDNVLETKVHEEAIAKVLVCHGSLKF